MKRYSLWIGLAAVAFLALIVTAHSQEDMVIVDNDVFDKPQRPPAVFEHEAHNEKAEIEECNLCHHIYEEGKLVEDESSEDQRCSDCHGLEAEENQPGLMKAYHLNCKGCHLKKKSGPVMCGECHVK